MLNIATGFEMFSSEYQIRKKRKMVELLKNGSTQSEAAGKTRSADLRRPPKPMLPVCKRIDMIAVEYNNGHYIQNEFYSKQIARSKPTEEYQPLESIDEPVEETKVNLPEPGTNSSKRRASLKIKPILRNNLTWLMEAQQSKTDLTKTSKVQFAEKRPDFFITQVDDLIDQEMKTHEISIADGAQLNLFQRGQRRRSVKLTAKFEDAKEQRNERRGAVTDNLLFRTGVDMPKPLKSNLKSRINSKSSIGERISRTHDEIIEIGPDGEVVKQEIEKKGPGWSKLRKHATVSKNNLNIFGLGKAFEENLFSGISQLTKDFKLSKGLLEKEEKLKDLQQETFKNLQYKKRAKFGTRSKTLGVDESSPGPKKLLFEAPEVRLMSLAPPAPG